MQEICVESFIFYPLLLLKLPNNENRSWKLFIGIKLHFHASIVGVKKIVYCIEDSRSISPKYNDIELRHFRNYVYALTRPASFIPLRRKKEFSCVENERRKVKVHWFFSFLFFDTSYVLAKKKSGTYTCSPSLPQEALLFPFIWSLKENYY